MKKKKVLLLSDDIRSLSGVARISKDLVINTADHVEWVQLGAKLDHEESGSIIDLSKSVNDIAGISNSYVRLYANSGYGDEIILKNIIRSESPDAILHITDPRYWDWLYNIERSIRHDIPLCYYHVWDNKPWPRFNEYAYKSCDWIGCISRLTYNAVKSVDTSREDWQTEYIPHGVSPHIYYPTKSAKLDNFKEQLFNGNSYKFVILSNNINIPRKQLPLIISAYKKFGDMLPTEMQKDILLILHTNPLHPSGTNLYELAREVCPDHDIIFSNTIIEDKFLNYMYNIADITINVASNEGFGLSTLESIMAGTPIIISNTGGLIDQMTMNDESIGKWGSIINPKVQNLIGSQQTPYIYSDICSTGDIAAALTHWHGMSPDTRKQLGDLGRDFAEKSLSSETMCKRIVDGISTAIEKFTPKPRISCTKI